MALPRYGAIPPASHSTPRLQTHTSEQALSTQPEATGSTTHMGTEATSQHDTSIRPTPVGARQRWHASAEPCSARTSLILAVLQQLNASSSSTPQTFYVSTALMEPTLRTGALHPRSNCKTGQTLIMTATAIPAATALTIQPVQTMSLNSLQTQSTSRWLGSRRPATGKSGSTNAHSTRVGKPTFFSA